MSEGNEAVFEVENPDKGPEYVESVGGEEIKAEAEEIQDTSPEQTEEVESPSQDEAPEEVVESYTPDFGYKFNDEQREFPEWIREVVKSKSEEDQVRDLFQRADALDSYKDRYSTLDEKYGETVSQNDKLVGRLDELDYYLDKKHYDVFFKEIGVSDQDIVNYVSNLLKWQDNPELLSQHQAVRDADIRQYQQQQDSASLKDQNQQLLRNQHNLAMEAAMNLPEVRTVREYVDGANGPGTFKTLVDEYGRAYYHENGGKDTTAEDAVFTVMNRYKKHMDIGAASGGEGLVEAERVQRQGKPGGHIPNVGKGSSASPVKKQPRSIDDLRKRYEELASRSA
jgi:hypothetical protein